MSSTKMWGRDAILPSRVARASLELESPPLQSRDPTSLVCDLVHRAFHLELQFIHDLHSPLTPSPCALYSEHATFISANNKPHNTQQKCPTTATTAAVTLAPASTFNPTPTPTSLTNGSSPGNTMPTCWKKTTTKSMTSSTTTTTPPVEPKTQKIAPTLSHLETPTLSHAQTQTWESKA
jgi:hypothetical protein